MFGKIYRMCDKIYRIYHKRYNTIYNYTGVPICTEIHKNNKHLKITTGSYGFFLGKSIINWFDIQPNVEYKSSKLHDGYNYIEMRNNGVILYVW